MSTRNPNPYFSPGSGGKGIDGETVCANGCKGCGGGGGGVLIDGNGPSSGEDVSHGQGFGAGGGGLTPEPGYSGAIVLDFAG